MTDNKTLGEAFGVIIDYMEKSAVETEKEMKRQRQLSDFYCNTGESILADEEAMNDEEWSIACQQYAMVRGMYHHHNRREAALSDWSSREKLMAMRLEYALDSM